MKRFFMTWLPALVLSAAFLFSSCKPSPGTEPSGTDPVKWVMTSVLSGTIPSVYTVPGTVTETERAVRTCTIPWNREDEARIRGLFGRSFRKGEEIYGTVRAEREEKVVQIAFEEEQVQLVLLCEEELEIQARVDRAHYGKIGYLTEVTVLFEGSAIPASVRLIDYHLNGGQAGVTVTCSGSGLLPGEAVSVRFVTDVRESGTYLLKDAVAFDVMGRAYVYAEQADGTFEKTGVVCGEEFTREENGYEHTYLEILSGVESGTLVRFQTADPDYASHIYEEFLK